MALRNTLSPNGLVRNSTAPAFMACTVIGTSPWPVMKMIGMSIRSTATRFCKSRPLRPGRETSSTRQLGTKTRGRARNSCADANVSGCQPSKRISNSSDSRTETSSSTTNTMDVASGMCADLDSPYSQSSIQRPEQRGLAEWLMQTLHRALGKHARADGLIAIRGNEHDGDLMPATRQFLLQLGAGHLRHRDVEEQRPGLLDKIRCEKRFRRRERLDLETELPQQVGERFAHRLVVVDDRHERSHGHHTVLSTAQGMANAKVAPGPSFGSAQIRP